MLKPTMDFCDKSHLLGYIPFLLFLSFLIHIMLQGFSFAEMLPKHLFMGFCLSYSLHPFFGNS